MALKGWKFRDLTEMNLFLSGGLLAGSRLGADLQSTNQVVGLTGKTLIFTAPAAVTVTFTAGANPNYHTLQEVRAQIVAAVGALSPFFYDNRLALVETTPTSGVAVTNAGTANAILGFSNTSAGRVYNPAGGAAPAFVQAYTTPDNQHCVITRES